MDGLFSGQYVGTDYSGVSNMAFRFGPQMPAFDAMPPHAPWSIVNATSSADPDGDGNGEIVVSDGTQWNEMVDMPNL